MELIRLFIAIEISSDTIRSLAALQQQLSDGQRLAGVRWVGPENFHVTLQFLGETNPEKVGLINAAMDSAGHEQKAFELHTEGLGFFPNPEAPRVLWTGVREVQPVNALARKLHAQLSKEFPTRGSVSPHITLARMNDWITDETLAKLKYTIARIEGKSVFGATHVNEICLFRSILGPEGPKYARLHTSKLS